MRCFDKDSFVYIVFFVVYKTCGRARGFAGYKKQR